MKKLKGSNLPKKLDANTPLDINTCVIICCRPEAKLKVDRIQPTDRARAMSYEALFN